MTFDQAFFLNTISDYIKKCPTPPREGINWIAIKRLSVSHQVEGIIYYQCKHFIPEEYKEEFQTAFLATLGIYVKRKDALQRLLDLLDSNYVYNFVIKGFPIADYYPEPSLRTMGDCDIIIHHADMGMVQRMLCEAGYQGTDNPKAHTWECYRSGMIFEFHDELVQYGEFTTRLQEEFFNNYDSYVRDKKLDINFHFLFLLMHLRKHFMNSGVGVRQFMDIAVVAINEQNLNWEWIRERITYLNLTKYAGACAALIDNWFGVEIPFGFSVEEDFPIDKITEKILGNGIFGGDDLRNKGNFERNKLIKAKGLLLLRRFSLVLKMAFPSYDYMRAYIFCEYLDKRPYLLPFAWLHRYFIYLTRKDRTTVSRVLINSVTSRERLMEHKELLDKMGL